MIRAKAQTRLAGLDAARGIALFGMMATHIFPLYTPGGTEATWTALLFAGRSSALFAVVAGVGLALLSGGASPREESISADRCGIAARAGVIALIALVLGGLSVNIAIILFHYAVLFLLALPFLRMHPSLLACWAVGWLALSPVAAYLLRQVAYATMDPVRLESNITWLHLGDPVVLFTDVFLTGYYPALQWLGYLLVGVFLGRLSLARLQVQAALLIAGAGVAAGAKVFSAFLLGPLGGFRALLQTESARGLQLDAMLDAGLGGLPQTDSWWWLAVSAPHSGSPLDLLNTSGSSAAVLGACLLLARILPALLILLSAPGAMTLTLYSAHIAAMSIIDAQEPPLDLDGVFWIQAFLAAGIGIAFAARATRGPLETITSTVSRGARESVASH